MSLNRFTRVFVLVSSLIAAGVALPAQGQVQVTATPLAPPDLWSTPGRDTGLGGDLWNGTSSDLARAVLPGLGTKPITPALRRLAIRLLSTGANAPEGAGADPTLAAERAAALTRLGAPDAAYTVLSRTPRVEASEPLSRARAEAALYLGRLDSACEAERAVQDGRSGGFWLRLRAFCQLQAGDGAAAQVTFDLWRQTGERAPAFAAAMSASFGGPPAPPALADALTYALSRRQGDALMPALAAASPAAVAVLALDDQTPSAVRGAAAAKAAALGLISKAQAAAAAPDAAAPSVDAVAAGPPPLPSIEDALGRTSAGSPAERTAARGDALLLSALSPSERPVTRAALAGLEAPAPKASAARLLALDTAAYAGRSGETALLALAAAGGLGGDLPVVDRALLVRALARVGLTADAEAVAREGLSTR